MGFYFSRPVLRRVCAACFPILLATSTSYAAEGLTLVDAQRIAASRSRQLAAQDRAVFASREMAVAAGQLPDPT
jgi:hypothetical protein